MTADAAIRVRGLRKSYDGREALRGIDFDVLTGEVKKYLYSLYPKNSITGEARLVYGSDGTMSTTIFPIGR